MTRVLRLDEAQYAALQKKARLQPMPQKTPSDAPKARISRPRGISEGEACLAFQLVGVKGWEREYRFAPPRRWRFDFAFPDRKLGIEVEGGQWTQGRHTRGKGFERDMKKYNAANMLKWAVLRFTTEEAKNGYAYQTIMEYLKC